MATTRIIIARHGNTFRAGETPTRVGGRTDLPLVEEHRGRSIGNYLKTVGLIPSAVFAAPLLRTMETARLAVEAMGVDMEVVPLASMVEIDYGPDENRTEEEVELRLGDGDRERGRTIVDAWNRDATVPPGWRVDPEQIRQGWLDFAAAAERDRPGRNTLLVTSNGIIRFAPWLTGDFDAFARRHDIKVATGGVCVFEKDPTDIAWRCTEWNIKPYK